MPSVNSQVQVFREAGAQAAQRGDFDSAIASYRKALAQSPETSWLHVDLGNLLRVARRPAEALEAFRCAIALTPNSSEIGLRLADTLIVLERTEEAISVLLPIAQASADPRARLALGKLYRAAKQPGKAIEWLASGLHSDPHEVDARMELGLALLELGRVADARDAFAAVVEREPKSLHAGFQFTLSLLQLGQNGEALEQLARLELLFPKDVQLAQLGLIAGQQTSTPSMVVDACNVLLTADPRNPAAMRALLGANADPAARETIKHRLSIHCRQTPQDIHSWRSLAYARFSDEGYESAIETLEEGLLATNDPSLRLYCALTLPKVPLSLDQIGQSRAAMHRHLDILIGQTHKPQNLLKTVNKTAIHLAYHGKNDKDLQRKIAAAHLAICPDLRWTAPHCGRRRRRSRLRIGVLSAHLHQNHAVGSMMGNLMAHLDPRKFKAFSLHISGAGDKDARSLGATVQEIFLPSTLSAARAAVAELELDFLLYPDIGMEPFSYYLAFSRLARVQGVWSGHPITTGIPEIDVFFSSVLSEPEDGDEHYSEKLIRLSKLPAYTTGRSPRADAANYLPSLDLHSAAHIYACPVMIYKFHPDFDRRLADILRKDPLGKLAIVGGSGYWYRALLQRFSTTIPDLETRVIVLPWLRKNEFFALLKRAEVVLDTLHFGGGNTSFDAFAVATPVVTQPGQFFRGRGTAAKYRQMGVEGLSVDAESAYVDLAVDLANDREKRSKYSAAIKENYPKLLMPPGLLAEYEACFAALIAEASLH